ncbi:MULTISPECIES: hypothetical protein [Nitrosopumilus]|uniref:hypothetical protein n=1 Tax=Nitrosopumilus TaxID=338191 RepID=UPI0003633A09|nr:MULTISPECIES: hypothetical protein [Nitrosopumilus]
MSLGAINAVRDLQNSITKMCYDYRQVNKLTGLENTTLKDLDAFLQELKDKQTELEES